jgi:hypothetical protein
MPLDVRAHRSIEHEHALFKGREIGVERGRRGGPISHSEYQQKKEPKRDGVRARALAGD